MIFGNGNGGGNPNHDENGKFTSANGASGGKTAEDKIREMGFDGDDEWPENEFKPVTSQEPETEEDLELDSFREYLDSNEGEFDRLLQIWGQETGNDPYDMEKPIDLKALYEIKKREDQTAAAEPSDTMNRG